MGLHIQPVKWAKISWAWLREVWAWAVICWRVWRLRNNGLWAAARHAVDAVMLDAALRQAASIEEQPRFCPSCGQIPDGDRRMDHARQIVMAILGNKLVKRSELDAAISLYYFSRK